MIIGKNIDLRDVEVSDAAFILSLRLDPDLNRYLSEVKNNLAKQEDWIKSYKHKDREWYFIVQNKQKQPIGTIRIYNIKEPCFCWGSWIITKEARKYATLESIVLLYKYAFFELGFTHTHFDVRKNNKKALNFYLRFGATITNEDEQDFFMSYTNKDFIAKLPEYSAAIDRIYD